VRYSYGYFAPFDILGTEEETLFDFIGGEILHRELLQDTFNSLRSGSDKASQIQEMQLLANRKVASAVKQTWKKAVDNTLPHLPDFLSTENIDKDRTAPYGLAELREMCPEARSAILQELFGQGLFKKFTVTMQLEAEIHSKLCSALSNIVDPVIFDAATSVCVPLLESIIQPFRHVYAEATSGFREDMQILINSGELSTRNFSRSSGGSVTPALHLSDDIGAIGLRDVLAAAHMRVNSGYNSGPLQLARQTLWSMYTTNLNNPEVLHCFSGKGLSAYDVYIRVSDSISDLVHSAIYTLGDMLQKASDGSVVNHTDGTAAVHSVSEELETKQCLDACIKLMEVDAELAQHGVLVDIFKR
jgi:hypothetical protein